MALVTSSLLKKAHERAVSPVAPAEPPNSRTPFGSRSRVRPVGKDASAAARGRWIEAGDNRGVSQLRRLPSAKRNTSPLPAPHWSTPVLVKSQSFLCMSKFIKDQILLMRLPQVRKHIYAFLAIQTTRNKWLLQVFWQLRSFAQRVVVCGNIISLFVETKVGYNRNSSSNGL